jgi:thiol:disulfide interchange protein
MLGRLVATLLCTLPGLAAAQSALVQTDEVRAELVAHAPQGLAPGKPAQLALLIEHRPHWHTYWKNPGDSGMPTTLRWTLPAGADVGAIDWPTPQRLPVGPLVNYGYEGTLLLPVPLVVDAGFSAPSLAVSLRAEWLVCREVCIPQSGEFTLHVPAATPSVAHAAVFAQARESMPQTAAADVRARVDAQVLALDVGGLAPGWVGKPVAFFAEQAGVIDHAGAVEQRWDGERLRLRVPLSAQRSESPQTLHAVLTVPGERAGAALRFAVDGGWPAPGQAAPATQPGAVSPPVADSAWGFALVLAFAGGVLLNLMPCVFPILSLKLLGFASHAGDRRWLAGGGLAYSAGVVVSFLLLAGVLLVLRAAGTQLGWGFQLQSPPFVAALALLFAVIGLNLLGVFEFGTLLPGRLAAHRARHPLVDHALTGVLAVAVASPCTAPFMGAAMGVALVQPPLQALAVFAALGAGMAAPYLAASLWPALVRRLPRPGPWMLHFRRVMAFPMFATVVWLVWVLGQQVGIDAAAALLGLLVALAFAASAFGAHGLGRIARRVWRGAGIAVLVLVATWAGPALFDTGQSAGDAAPQARWQPWSSDAVERARAAGRPVFVDFTAAWCVTCQFNKRTTLGDEALLAELDARRVLLLRADWTRQDPQITQELARLGRNGVPVYALYAPDGTQAPRLLSEILSVAEVREAIGPWPVHAPPVAGAAAAAAIP